MKIRNFLKKTLAVVLVLAMLAPIMGNLKTNVKEVQAEGTEQAEDVVKPEFMSVKCQVTQGVVTNTEIEKYRDNYVMRFVSSVDDYKNYKEVGFKIQYKENPEDTTYVEKTAVVKTVFKRIESTTGSTADGKKETYAFSPKVISTDSEYLMTAKLPISPEDKAVDYTVWAYGIKSNGTRVEGQRRCVCVNDGLKGCSTINMSFDKNDGVGMTDATSLTANDNYTATVIGEDDTTVHVRIAGVTTTLPSATKFTFKNGDTEVGSGILRNLYTEYNGNADKSWYEVYAGEGKTEFVIATDADLYGFSALSTGGNTFAGKTVYMVADISANEDSTVDGVNGSKIGSPYVWNPIGPKDITFAGIFDGQGHTISNIYYEDTANNTWDHGFFGVATDTTVVRNFSIKDSYFIAGMVAGSVAGKPKGTFDNIYSNAFVQSGSQYIGGLFGSLESEGKTTTIENCWFDGTVTSSGGNTGGIAGLADKTGKKIISNCLVTGSVKSNGNYVGGILGHVDNKTNSSDTSKTPLLLTNCIASPKTLSGNNYVGGAIGFVDQTTATGTKTIINDVYNTTETKGVVYGVMQYGAVSDSVDLTGDNGFVNTMLDFDKYWTTVKDSTPELRTFAEEELEVPNKNRKIVESLDWACDVAGTESDPYLLEDAADLYGFTKNPWGLDFDGKVIKLKNDITFNVDINNEENRISWINIGSTANPFAATFDGQGYTISGIYYQSDKSTYNHGFFGETTDYAVVKNFSLKDSKFIATVVTGSIAAKPKGRFESIYSDADVITSGQYTGGLFGSMENTEGSTTTIENCWFAGTVTSSGPNAGGVAGYAAEAGKKIISNCLVTGSVTSDSKHVGGILGEVKAGTPVLISDSLTTAETSGSSDVHSVVGSLNEATVTTSEVVINQVYTTNTKESVGNGSLKCGSVSAPNLIGEAGYLNTYLDFENYWTTVTNGTPELRTFAKVVQNAPTGERLESTIATEEELKLLQNLYSTTPTLYQGELHAHAKTLDKGDDGTTSLQTWMNTQMGENNLSFAASLDHHQTSQFTNATLGWNKSKLIYGTEAGTTITDIDDTLDGEVHYNMLFPSNVGLEKIISEFGYKDSSKLSVAQNAAVTSGLYEFGYRDFSKAEFQELIQAIKDQGGFFVHAHPTQTSYSTKTEDYWFADYVGFEVLYINTPEIDGVYKDNANYATYGAYGTKESRAHYNVWNTLLKNGKRLYATAGSDTHGNLNTYALTSVYSTTEAEADKGTIITQLRAGDFTAGSVGIQMCIDNTTMGGHFKFTDSSRLVVNVDKFHFSTVVPEAHKYRVDVITEDGVVYSRPLTIDGETATPTNGKIALKVDPSCEYYRVEVVDALEGHRIAIGQPIWNDNN